MRKLEIKTRMSKMGLSRDEMARKLGISSKTLDRYNSGHGSPKLTELIKMAEIFGCSMDDLVSPPLCPPNSGGNGLIPETPRGASLVGDLREVVELLANLALRSDEPGEVLAFLEDLADGRADKEDTKVFIETLTTQIDASVRFLRSVGVSLGHIHEGRFSDVGSVAQEASCLSGS